MEIKKKVRRLVCLDITKKIIEHCDIIYALRDWKNSNGARIEIDYAQTLGKKIVYEGEE